MRKLKASGTRTNQMCGHSHSSLTMCMSTLCTNFVRFSHCWHIDFVVVAVQLQVMHCHCVASFTFCLFCFCLRLPAPLSATQVKLFFLLLGRYGPVCIRVCCMLALVTNFCLSFTHKFMFFSRCAFQLNFHIFTSTSCAHAKESCGTKCLHNGRCLQTRSFTVNILYIYAYYDVSFLQVVNKSKLTLSRSGQIVTGK